MEVYNLIQENWDLIKLELKKRYPQLTEGDLNLINGYEFEMFKNLQAKTGKSREEFMAELKAVLKEKSKLL